MIPSVSPALLAPCRFHRGVGHVARDAPSPMLSTPPQGFRQPGRIPSPATNSRPPRRAPAPSARAVTHRAGIRACWRFATSCPRNWLASRGTNTRVQRFFRPGPARASLKRARVCPAYTDRGPLVDSKARVSQGGAPRPRKCHIAVERAAGSAPGQVGHQASCSYKPLINSARTPTAPTDHPFACGHLR